MPLIDRIKTLFARKGETEKKIAFLAERKAALSQQRDRSYEELAAIEQQEEELKRQFKESSSAITRRRLTSQIVQLRKDIERRQQLMSVLNQQINVVGTHLHNLELTQQGKAAKLPDSDEIATDAAAAEEMLAQLQADNELADSVGTIAHAGLSAEEQAVYEELEKESGGPATTKVELNHAEPPAENESPKAPAPKQETKRRSEPEAG
jgi:membrane-bound lytic murein transglycosylase MltF